MKKQIMLLIVCFLHCSIVQAQDATLSDLKVVIARLKSLKTYSYETVTNIVFPNGQKDQKVTTMYMDGNNKRLCYYDRFQLLLLTDKWAYQADHRLKHVSVFDVKKYNNRFKNELPELEAIFQANLAVEFMDSILLKSGKLTSAKRKGNLTTYSVSFPAGYYVREMVIVFDEKKNLPETIDIKCASGTVPGRKNGSSSMQMLCRKYDDKVPESVFNTEQYFSIARGKPVLARYKNYKVSSVL